MLLIDGSMGEGGGQLLRSSLTLSLVLGRPFRMANIRAGRKVPGLRAQHLTCIRAAADICNADVSKLAVGASELVFEPGPVRAGTYRFDVGTAGSATLVLQTIALALVLATDASSTVTLEGGTHNPMAPTFDFLERTYLPQLARMGGSIHASLEQHGFAPAGGGRIVAHVTPLKLLEPFALLDRGEVRARRARALVANLPIDIAHREVATIRRSLGLPADAASAEAVAARGSGNVAMIEIESDHVTEVFAAFGERGVRAERVAKTVADEAIRYEKAAVPAGEHLADQLLLPMVLGQGGGSFRTSALSGHTRTQIDLLKQWTSVEIEAEQEPAGAVTLRVPPFLS